jgi:hypothetical protein
MARLDPASLASVNLRFILEDFDSRPPRGVDVAGCGLNVRIANIDFDGDSGNRGGYCQLV